MIRTPVLAAATLAGAAGCLVAVPVATAGPVPACGNRDLRVTASAQEGATGHGSLVLRFRNRAPHTCSLRGYPGLDALGVHGHVLAHARRTPSGFAGGSRHGVTTVVLRPGRFASARVEWLDFHAGSGRSCRFSHSVAATPADTSRTVTLRRAVGVCALQVHPTVRGRSGNG